MKQQITQEQLNEISPEQQLRYLKALKLDRPGQAVMLPDIGHLVWFLDAHTTGYWYVTRTGSRQAWYVEFMQFDYDGKGVELIDALWDAAKAVLSSELRST